MKKFNSKIHSFKDSKDFILLTNDSEQKSDLLHIFNAMQPGDELILSQQLNTPLSYVLGFPIDLQSFFRGGTQNFKAYVKLEKTSFGFQVSYHSDPECQNLIISQNKSRFAAHQLILKNGEWDLFQYSAHHVKYLNDSLSQLKDLGDLRVLPFYIDNTEPRVLRQQKYFEQFYPNFKLGKSKIYIQMLKTEFGVLLQFYKDSECKEPLITKIKL